MTLPTSFIRGSNSSSMAKPMSAMISMSWSGQGTQWHHQYHSSDRVPQKVSSCIFICLPGVAELCEGPLHFEAEEEFVS